MARPDFDTATAVRALEVPGGYAAEIRPEWDGPVAPNGGLLASIMLRAARIELGSDPPPRTLSVHFPRPARHGAATVTVEVLRRGRTSALASLSLHQGDRLICAGLLTSSAARPAPELPLPEPSPPSPAYADVARVEPPNPPPMVQRLDLRPALGSPPFGAAREALTGGWLRFRDDSDDQPLDPERLTTLCDAWWPAVFAATDRMMGVPTLELTVHFRRQEPVAGPAFARFRTRTVSDGHFEESGELRSADGSLLAESRQIAVLIAS